MSNDASGRTCLLLLDVDTLVKIRHTDYTCCYDCIPVRVIAMLLGTLVTNPVAHSPSTDHTWPCVKVISAVLSCVGGHRAAVRLFP